MEKCDKEKLRKPTGALLKEEQMALFADYYELTMGKADLDHATRTITENYFVRKIPQGAYMVTAGLEQVIHYILNIRFTTKDLEWLQRTSGQDFTQDFLNYMEHFQFSGDIYAMPEGTVAFPGEPIINMTGNSIEVQLFETYLLNVMNFQTLVATKAARVVEAAGGKPVLEFGARRAHGRDAALLGARAAYIGGATGTSLTLAGRLFDIPYIGTMAHKFVQERPSELQAFREYAESFPHNCTLLIDTYDTIQGAKNAVIVGKELEAKGYTLKGVRLDSGDLLTLSKAVRKILDEAGLSYVKIFVSNDLDEYEIDMLLRQGAPIDGFGVGTRLITGANYHQLTGRGGVSALGGIYKLVEILEGVESIAKMKFSDDRAKMTLPGRKQVYRFVDKDGLFVRDEIRLWAEEAPPRGIPLLQPTVLAGQQAYSFPTVRDIQAYATAQKARLPRRVKVLDPLTDFDTFPVSISPGIEALIEKIRKEYRGGKK